MTQNVAADISTAAITLKIERKQLAANDRLANQLFDNDRFIFSTAGVVAIITEQGRYLVPPEHGIWLPANTAFQLIATTTANLVCYLIDEIYQAQRLQTTTVVEVNNFLKSLIIESISEAMHDYDEASLQHLQHLLADRIQAAQPLSLLLPAVKDQRLTAITSRQQKFPALKTDLVAWGKFVHASPRTLSRVFKNETGITYSEWKQIMVIHIAIIQLCLGESIAIIAKNLGYESSSAFIYMFKKHMKVTPSNYLSC